ncbi:MAG TPA: 3-hydroxybutyryl-CoA dehydrogenase [Chitinophagaceae bacterium]|nr:3-hydroxybutyryl-CoA dehydrogenase [Chitinophagaceae bacterium]HAN38018.1 3-hydroxybutyryl-CoA dehydrogenase [Chitinophagaceae bacterium]
MFARNQKIMAITTIAVCGAGTMGSGIAQAAAQNNFKTILFDVNSAVLAKAKDTIVKSIDNLTVKGKLTQAQAAQTLAQLHFTDNIADCKADVVIEAIVEKLDAKVSLLQQLALVNSEATILATNTSSIPVSAIAAAVPKPERVAGMHFFNPATIMRLVEVVRGTHTNDATIDALVTLAKQLQKQPVVCKDAPGFIVNRVARPYYLEAMQLVTNGEVTDIALIDEALQNSGFKMGPFALMDLIGLDINYSVSNIVWDALGQPKRLTPSSLQGAKVAAGDLGKKTGKGFYNYTT